MEEDPVHAPSACNEILAIKRAVAERLVCEACALASAGTPGVLGRVLGCESALAAVQLVVSDPALVARAVQAAREATAYFRALTPGAQQAAPAAPMPALPPPSRLNVAEDAAAADASAPEATPEATPVVAAQEAIRAVLAKPNAL